MEVIEEAADRKAETSVLSDKIRRYAETNQMKTNNYALSFLEQRVESAISRVKRQPLQYGKFFVDMPTWYSILEDVTDGIRNPENNAVRDEIHVRLEVEGYIFVSNGITKVEPKTEKGCLKPLIAETTIGENFFIGNFYTQEDAQKAIDTLDTNKLNTLHAIDCFYFDDPYIKMNFTPVK